MYKTLKSINSLFLNSRDRKKIILFFLFSLMIPFLELISIATLSGIVLIFVNFENFISNLPELFFFEKSQIIKLDKFFLLKVLSTIVFIAVLVKNFIVFLYFYFEKSFSKSMVIEQSNKLFKNYLSLPFIEYKNLSNSDIQNEILYQTKKISSYIFFVLGLIKDLIIASLFLISLFFLNFYATLGLIIVSIITGMMFQFITSKKIRILGNEVRNLQGRLIDIVQVSTDGIKSIILFLKKNFFYEKFFNNIRKKEDKEMNYFLISKIPRLLVEVIFMFLIVILMFFFLQEESSLEEYLPFFVTLSIISVRLIPIVSNINLILSNLNYLEPALNEIFKSYENQSQQVEEYNKSDQAEIVEKIYQIELKDISFKYDNSNVNILSDINLKFTSGKTYCIIGSTGSGKSTLLDIILGLLSPTKGKMYCNNKIQIKPNNISWFKKISYVPQESFIYDDTLFNNICLENENNSNEKIRKSIEISELNRFAEEIQNKKIGFRGQKISGGQKQRIGIARALFKENEIIIMDEATNALDELTEKKILTNIKKDNFEKIIINVSHRLGTIKFADEIIYLKDGKIKFQGSPKEFFPIR